MHFIETKYRLIITFLSIKEALGPNLFCYTGIDLNHIFYILPYF
jgi:hypothetical protein